MDVLVRGTYSRIELQHLDYNHIIGRGYVSPSSILKLLELSRGTMQKRTNIPGREDGKRMHFFVIWQQLEILPHYYVSENVGHWKDLGTFMNRRIEIFQKFSKVGGSSQVTENAINDMTSGQPIAYFAGKIVNVDPETRKPLAYPKAYKEYMNSSTEADFIKIDRKIPDKCTNVYDIPKNATVFQQSARVTAFQIDCNNHMNQASYVSHSFDCLAQALQEGFTTNMKHPIWNYPLKRVSVLYLKECFLGEKVTTIVWQDDLDEWVFHFHIKQDDKVACQVELEFYPGKPELIRSKL